MADWLVMVYNLNWPQATQTRSLEVSFSFQYLREIGMVLANGGIYMEKLVANHFSF
jgi:hypothetical protein